MYRKKHVTNIIKVYPKARICVFGKTIKENLALYNIDQVQIRVKTNGTPYLAFSNSFLCAQINKNWRFVNENVYKIKRTDANLLKVYSIEFIQTLKEIFDFKRNAMFSIRLEPMEYKDPDTVICYKMTDLEEYREYTKSKPSQQTSIEFPDDNTMLEYEKRLCELETSDKKNREMIKIICRLLENYLENPTDTAYTETTDNK